MKELLKKHPQYYYVSSKGFVENGRHANPKKTALRKEFGNYFKTYRMADDARLRMMKMFKRLKGGK